MESFFLLEKKSTLVSSFQRAIIYPYKNLAMNRYSRKIISHFLDSDNGTRLSRSEKKKITNRLNREIKSFKYFQKYAVRICTEIRDQACFDSLKIDCFLTTHDSIVRTCTL